ncbi:MlaD family protein [Caballeronia zhejiangensis]|uniref:Mammalian cell entry protein n=1 Tax=Caballeronia zhejiangensis TaxID=871203 RepID=A0A656Q9W3_9BURK|nr:MlaD family protein [Caballeronia zhejiangensis]AET95407.1 hypothetical protein BYI23_E002460 [Burkholderia sp. YI23]KAK42479.1 mammalian cell entry protein [Caballeronia jiangsuensis]KDR24703.1 mammalian cell entry protein [Caballeronia zhejiangensis]BBQ03172.1 mammalian cell entry protein [Burkholderia sp. SFA1]
MENKAHALVAGVFVLVMTALLAGLAWGLTRDRKTYDLYEITTRDAVSGLAEQAPVRFRGVPVGQVASIGFDPQARGQVRILLSVERGAPVSTATFATIATQGVTGLGFIQLDEEAAQAATAQPLAPNDDQPPRIPLRPGFLDKLKTQGEVILDQFEQASTRFNQLLGDGNQKAFTQTLDSLNRLALKLDRQVDPALVSLRRGTDAIGSAAGEFGKVAQRLNEKNGAVDRLTAGTEALAQSAEGFNAVTLPRLNRAADELTRGARQVYRTANLLGDNPRSLIFGAGPAAAGPGEPGFAPPDAAERPVSTGD